MRKYRVGLLTFSDGRRYQHDQLLPINRAYQRKVKEAIEGTEEATVIEGREIIWSNETARMEANRIAHESVDVVVFNYAIWCFPHLSAIAAGLVHLPILLFSNLNPSEPGLVGMLASAGAMDQLGHAYQRVWGDISPTRPC